MGLLQGLFSGYSSPQAVGRHNRKDISSIGQQMAEYQNAQVDEPLDVWQPGQTLQQSGQYGMALPAQNLGFNNQSQQFQSGHSMGLKQAYELGSSLVDGDIMGAADIASGGVFGKADTVSKALTGEALFSQSAAAGLGANAAGASLASKAAVAAPTAGAAVTGAAAAGAGSAAATGSVAAEAATAAASEGILSSIIALLL